MDKDRAISTLKQLVQGDIRYLCRRADLLWNAPIVQTLRDLRDCGGKSVFFGGAVRSLLFSRLLRGRLGRPRDVDIVVDDMTLEGLKERFGNFVTRETRYGGLQLLRGHWHFDVWPLHRTWAFVNHLVEHASFQELPRTTFFNLEAIAVEVWPAPGATRCVFSGDDYFFEGVLSRTLELNLEDNPFPSLCVVRALVMASKLDLWIGPKLTNYLIRHSEVVKDEELASIQQKHYGSIRVRPEEARSWMSSIRTHAALSQGERVRLPISRQQSLWPNDEDIWPRLAGILRRQTTQDASE